MEIKKLELTEEEKKELQGKEEELREVLTIKAVYDVASKYEFSEAEQKELKYIVEGEKVKYYIAKQIGDKITVDEDELTKIYTDNKAYFDSQQITFSQARELIHRDLFNNQIITLENKFILDTIEELKKSVEITKEEILFSNGNAEVLKTLVTNKVINAKMEKEKFEEKSKSELEIVESNILTNFYLDIQIRGKVSVTQEEVEEIYKKEQQQFVNVPPQEAYNQIANNLFAQKVNNSRSELIEKIVKDYNVESIVKENM